MKLKLMSAFVIILVGYVILEAVTSIAGVTPAGAVAPFGPARRVVYGFPLDRAKEGHSSWLNAARVETRVASTACR